MGLLSNLYTKLSLKSDCLNTAHTCLIATLTQILSPSECSAIELDDQTLESLLSPEPRTLSSYELLPIEIHNQIITCAERGDILTNDNPLLKTLRLVSKAFHAIATPRLFHTVVLYQHLDRWEALNNIARHPELAKHVERIQLSCLLELPGITANEDETDIHYENFVDPQHASMADHPPDGGHLALLDHVDLDQRYARYRLWKDKEKIVAAGYDEQKAPVLDLQLFGPLEIETVGPLELSTVKRKGIDTATWNPTRRNYCTRRQAETDVAEDGVPEYNWVDRHKTSPEHLHLFMYASMAAGANITSLTLRYVDELTECNADFEVPNLRQLRLDFGVKNSGLYCSPYLGVWYLGAWLRSGKLTKLQEITLSQHPETEDAVDVIATLDQTYFPSLARVTLVSPETTGAALFRFVHRHWPTLQYLSISAPLVRPSDWNWFLAMMRNIDRRNEWRYDGKRYKLAREPQIMVQDELLAKEYWDERWKRPQDQKVLHELSTRVKFVRGSEE